MKTPIYHPEHNYSRAVTNCTCTQHRDIILEGGHIILTKIRLQKVE